MICKQFRRIMDWRSFCVLLLFFTLAVVGPVEAREDSIEEAKELIQQVHELYGQGRYSAALRPAARALDILEQALGPTHPETATSLNDLAAFYQGTKVYKVAAAFLERVLLISEQALGLEHPDTAEALHNLAVLYKATEPIKRRFRFTSGHWQ